MRFAYALPLAALLSVPSSATEVKLFVLAGTSNMWGQGFVSDVPPPRNAPQDDVWMWQDDLGDNVGWTALRPGFGVTSNNFGSGGNTLRCNDNQQAEGRCGKDELGPELTLGRLLADAFPDYQIALLKHAGGGSDLFEVWNPNTPGPADNKHLYAGLTEKMADATQALADAGLSYEVAGLFWEQGGGDAKKLDKADIYESNLTDLISAIRDDFAGHSEMPFVIGRSNSYLSSWGSYPFLDQVRSAQVAVANADPLGAWVDGDDLSRRPNDVHYDAAGQLELGRRFAGAYLGVAVPEPSTITLAGLAAICLFAFRRRKLPH